MNERKYASDIYSSWAQGTYLYVKWAERHQINYYEMLVMYVLDTNGNLTQKAIGDYLGLPKQTINNVIRKWKAEAVSYTHLIFFRGDESRGVASAGSSPPR